MMDSFQTPNKDLREVFVHGSQDEDDLQLEKLGYKQQYRRDLNLVQTFSVAISILSLLPSIAATLSYNLGDAGLAGSVWGWLAAAIPIQFVALSLAEICSAIPTVGGLYYAAAVLAPKGWGPLCSWFVGWSNVLGFSVAALSSLYAAAQMILGAATVTSPDFVPQNWQLFLVTLALLLLTGLASSLPTKWIGRFNLLSMVWNFVIIVIFIIWILAGHKNGPLNKTSHVWLGIENGTSWPDGWALCLGLTSVVYTMAGYDSPFHLSEECRNANIAGPRAIVMTAQTGLWAGWALILVIAYTVSDISEVLNGPHVHSMVNLCVQVLGPGQGLTLLSFNIIAQFTAAQGCVVYLSRVIFAYSRDGAMPGSSFWRQLNRHTQTPLNAVWLIIVFEIIVSSLIFAGVIAINAVFTVVVIGQYVAFTTPVALKLFFGHGRFKPGPWNLGRFSRPVNAVAVAFGLFIIPVLTFPAFNSDNGLTPKTMNWTCVLWGGSMAIALVWYAVDARKWFKGPAVESVYLQWWD